MTNEQQLVRINDWLSAHAPDLYRDRHDTATTVIRALNRLRDQLTEWQEISDEWKDKARQNSAEIIELRAEIEAMSAENDRLRAALGIA